MRRPLVLVFSLAAATIGSTVLLSALVWNEEDYGYRNETIEGKFWVVVRHINVTVPPTHVTRSATSSGPPVISLKQQNSTADSDNDTATEREDREPSLVNETLQTRVTPQAASLKPPVSQPKDCTEANCGEFLSQKDKILLRICKRTMDSFFRKNRHVKNITVFIEPTCSFMKGDHRMPIALASIEGSGNTWVRGLLETVTGICTGFAWCDPIMRAHGFIGENIKSGSVLVVKTHTAEPKWLVGEIPKESKPLIRSDPQYGSAIFILRNPYNSLIAEWNRKVTTKLVNKKQQLESHTHVIDEKYWHSPEWDEFLHTYMEKWKQKLENWVITVENKPVLVVRYEDLKVDTFQEVKKMLDFIGIEYEATAVKQRLMDDYNHFKRNHSADQFEHYTTEQKQHIATVLAETIEAAQRYNKSKILRLDEYLSVTS